METGYLCLIAAAIGLALAWFMTRPAELRGMRFSQLVLVPLAMAGGAFASTIPGAGGFMFFACALIFLVILLAPNAAYLMGLGLSNLIDPQDWNREETEIKLKPIRDLIDKDNYREALGELEKLLATRRPTFEAVLLKARLLHHIGRINEAETALHELIRLCDLPAQQLAVMEMLDFIAKNDTTASAPEIAPGLRRIEINHELLLLPVSADGLSPNKEIPPGMYEVDPIACRNRRWLKLKSEDWGNAEACWNAVAGQKTAPAAPPKIGLLGHIARLQEGVGVAIKGKPRRQLLQESQDLFAQARESIRRGDWKAARPLLEQASTSNPDRYEIAYRWAEAVNRTADAAETRQVVQRILQQSQWSTSEKEMLEQLGKGN